jgi:hypothetical protein|tara:strand:- start:4476 stop:4838 length:363 start_codon:yes stop_codon:yes gene_type:complete
MGFIPIFITLGGFVFLFMMVVNHNLKQKKQLFETELTQFSSTIKSLFKSSNGNEHISVVKSIKEAEALYHALKSNEKTHSEAVKAQKKLGEIRMLRHNYNKLIKTKPYSFVATLMGHHSI